MERSGRDRQTHGMFAGHILPEGGGGLTNPEPSPETDCLDLKRIARMGWRVRTMNKFTIGSFFVDEKRGLWEKTKKILMFFRLGSCFSLNLLITDSLPQGETGSNAFVFKVHAFVLTFQSAPL